jgi:hypothetical protein
LNKNSENTIITQIELEKKLNQFYSTYNSLKSSSVIKISKEKKKKIYNELKRKEAQKKLEEEEKKKQEEKDR